jgi:hypothetical protein
MKNCLNRCNYYILHWLVYNAISTDKTKNALLIITRKLIVSHQNSFTYNGSTENFYPPWGIVLRE